MAPTQKQLSTVYSAQANKYFKDGKAVTLRAAPQGIAGIKPLAFRDVRGVVADDKAIYIVKGQVYVKTTTQTPLNAQQAQQSQQATVIKWQSVGPANIRF